MNSFFENPLQEKKLSFQFAEGEKTTRYEKWDSHINIFQLEALKAVDFICLISEAYMVIFTEIKDFGHIDHAGRYGQGLFSRELADDVAQKLRDTYDGIGRITDKSPHDEYAFVCALGTAARRFVFHWEFKPSISQHQRLWHMQTMKMKLRKLLHGINTHIRIENMLDNPSKYWTVTRRK